MRDREERPGAQSHVYNISEHASSSSTASAGRSSFEDDSAIEGRGHEIAPLRQLRDCGTERVEPLLTDGGFGRRCRPSGRFSLSASLNEDE